jgi:hypothetical protein
MAFAVAAIRRVRLVSTRLLVGRGREDASNSDATQHGDEIGCAGSGGAMADPGHRKNSYRMKQNCCVRESACAELAERSRAAAVASGFRHE